MNNKLPSPLLSCCRFELKKFLGRRLVWIILTCELLSVIGSLMLERDSYGPGEGYSLFAALLTRSMPLASFLVMIMATLSVNEEIAAGSLRAVLLRPVSKAHLLSAKLLLNVGFAAFLAIFVLGAAWLAVEFTSEFAAIRIEIPGLEPRDVFSAEEMRAIAWKLSLAMIAPILASAAFGTLISVLIESEGTAVAIGTFLFLAMQAVGPLAPEIADYLFPTYLELPIALLGELAGQDQTRQLLVEAWGVFSAGYVAPTAMTIIFGALAVIVFDKKEIAC